MAIWQQLRAQRLRILATFGATGTSARQAITLAARTPMQLRWALRRVAAALCCGLAACHAAGAEPLDACALAQASGSAAAATEAARVQRITGANALLLADGREIRLAGISTPHRFTPPASQAAEADAVRRIVEGDARVDPLDPQPLPDAEPGHDPMALARARLAGWLTGEAIRISAISPTPDRYGRLRARVVRVKDGLWVEAELVALGLARVEPQLDDVVCARHLEAVEAAARDAGRGLWALPEFAVLEANDPTRDRFTGHYVLIEGKIVSLGASGARRYLNFGRNFARDFAVLLVDKGSPAAAGGRLAKGLENRFRSEGFEAPDVVGKRIRVRGILTRGGGGLILPAVPEDLEWLPDDP